MPNKKPREKKATEAKTTKDAQPSRALQAEPDILKGRFTNTISVAHTKFDFCVDFIAVDPLSNLMPAQVVGRFYMTPAQTKLTRDVLDKQVRDYEEKYGDIETK